MRTIAHRVLGPTWGIAIDLTAASATVTTPPPDAHRIGPRIWLDPHPVLHHPPTDRAGLRLSPAEAQWLRHGLVLSAESIEATLPPERLTLVTTHRVLFPETHFQPEGLAGAMMTWCAEEFALAPPTDLITFDPAANRFRYGWEQHPPSQQTAPARTPRRTRFLT
ncbi:hypothetical protein [Streptomyces sp. NPDC054887]